MIVKTQPMGKRFSDVLRFCHSQRFWHSNKNNESRLSNGTNFLAVNNNTHRCFWIRDKLLTIYTPKRRIEIRAALSHQTPMKATLHILTL